MGMDAAQVERMIAEAVTPLHAKIAAQAARIAELESQLKVNSRNSSKAPSTDIHKPAPKSLRTPSGKKSGGQPGHDGTTLLKAAKPDHTVEHRPPPTCDACGSRLPDAVLAETRQVFDIPNPKFEVTEHRVFSARCTCGKTHGGVFPASVSSPVQYGYNAKALVVHLTQNHMLPVARTGRLFGDIFGMPLSDATILAMRDEAKERLAPEAQAIGEALLRQPVLHPDETGMRACGTLFWMHVAATRDLTWYFAHAKRGGEAMDAGNILPRYDGIAVHDCLASYFDYDFTHALCLAHISRELVFTYEVGGQSWAMKMKELLSEANDAVRNAGGPLDTSLLKKFRRQYGKLVAQGEKANPAPERTRRRGRPKRGKIGSLVHRLKTLKDAVWRFATEKGVPFTNNLAEQAVRMPKVKQKVSGCFRTKAGLDAFCTIRTVTETIRKQGGSALEALTAAFRGQPVGLRLA